MELIKELNDIKDNIKTMDKYLHDNSLVKFTLGLIRRGTCFVAEKRDNGYAFYPSRFIGYLDNNYTAHTNNNSKDGRVTNPAISEILGHEPSPSKALEIEYRKYCDKLGFIANNKGTFGVEHKYWEI